MKNVNNKFDKCDIILFRDQNTNNKNNNLKIQFIRLIRLMMMVQ